MTIYKPVFETSNEWSVHELDIVEMRQLGTSNMFTRYREGVGHYGTIYENPFYLTKEAAWKYIHKDCVSEGEMIRL